MKITINEKEYNVEEGITILDAAKKIGVEIPHFCHHDDLPPLGACRICVVEVDGARTLAPSCATKVAEGMKVKTHSRRVVNARRSILDLILSNHDMNCPTCARNQHCNLQKLASEFAITNLKYAGEKRFDEIDESSVSFTRNPQKCILCEKCVRICRDVQQVNCIDFKHRGFDTQIGVPYKKKIADTECTNCGQCVVNCPVGALYEKESIRDVVDAIEAGKHVIVQTAPSIRVSLGEMFGMAPGTNVQGKMVAALRKIGFTKVFDTSLGADLTIVEESTELVNRIKNNGTLPMFTSCCPGWVKYMEHFFPENINHFSSCKAPHMMLGAVIKSYYAEKFGIPAKDIVVVSIMPCIAKKFEAQRDEMKGDVDFVLTTRELGRLIMQEGIDFNSLKDEEFDSALGLGTGAGQIFGATGGVMEAALRTAYVTQTGKPLEKLEFDQIRGTNGIKTGTIIINGKTIRFAVASGLSNAKKIMLEKEKYDFVEIMACPGGCIGGGGQPIPTNKRIMKERMLGIYNIDKNSPLRLSHENPIIKQLYKEYFGEYGSEKAHKLLHTRFMKRGI